MRKFKLLVLLLLAGTTVFFSRCKKDETFADPTISFQNGTTSLVFNGTNSISVNVTFAAEGKIESVTLSGPSLTGTGTTSSPITNKMGTSGTDNVKGETSATYLFNVSAADLLLAKANHTTGFTYTFTIVDQEDKSTTGTFTVTYPATVTYGDIDTWTGKTLGAQNASEGSYLASSTGAVLTQTQATANPSIADISYLVLNTGAESFVSPSERATYGYGLTGGTITYFDVSSISASTFDLLTNDSLIKDIPTLTPLKVSIANGGVYSFINAAGKKGLIKVTALQTGQSGKVTISVKVQK